MGEFATMGGDTSIPSTGSSTYENALGLTNPDNILTGTQRGQQALGAPNIKTDSANQRIVVNDNTTNRVSFGKIGTGTNDWGLKVSKPTFNVDSATSDQLIFNSAQNIFKIAQTGVATIPAASGSGTNSTSVTVTHSLGYVPGVIAYIQQTGGLNYPLPYLYTSPTRDFFNNPIGYIRFIVDVASATTTTVSFETIVYDGTTSVNAIPVKYYLLQETAN